MKKDIYFFIGITFFLSAFFIAAALEKISHPYLLGTYALGGVFLLCGVTRAFRYIHATEKISTNVWKNISTIEAVLLGALSTYALANNMHLGPIVSASLVGTIASLFCSLSANESIKNLSVPIYCGAFVGMTSPLIMGNILTVAMAGIITAFVFVVATRLFVGVGGKLGTLAFVGTASTMLLLTLFKFL